MHSDIPWEVRTARQDQSLECQDLELPRLLLRDNETFPHGNPTRKHK